jgi:hypothetical protein
VSEWERKKVEEAKDQKTAEQTRWASKESTGFGSKKTYISK